MDQRLQQAIDAARAGETTTAQQLLTQLLKEDPEQTQAWFLLSHLVDSEQKQKAYLGKVLALDPAHEQARQRLALVRSGATGGAAPAVAAPDLDVSAQADGDTVPDWMTDAGAPAAPAAEAPPAEPTPAEAIPEWLQQPADLSEPAAAGETAVETAAADEAVEKRETAVAKPAKPAKPAAAPQASSLRWNILLAFLVIVALIVLYLLFQAIQAM